MNKYVLMGCLMLSSASWGANIDSLTAQAIRKNALQIRAKADSMAAYADYASTILDSGGKLNVNFTGQAIPIPQPTVDQLLDTNQVTLFLNQIQALLIDTQTQLQSVSNPVIP